MSLFNDLLIIIILINVKNTVEFFFREQKLPNSEEVDVLKQGNDLNLKSGHRQPQYSTRKE